MQPQLVAFAGRARQQLRFQGRLGLVGVVAAEIDRLAHLGHGIAPGLARFDYQQGAELGAAGFERVSGAAQHGGTLGQWRRTPAVMGGVQARH